MQCLITAISEVGLVVQILGFFEGTVDEFHLPPGAPEDNFKLGQKLKARVLYEVAAASPPRFALSLAEHVLKLSPKQLEEDDEETAQTLQEAYPIGTTLEGVKVTKVEMERGLLLEVQEGLQGFVHVSIPAVQCHPWLTVSTDIACIRRTCGISTRQLWRLEDWLVATSTRDRLLPTRWLATTLFASFGA